MLVIFLVWNIWLTLGIKTKFTFNFLRINKSFFWFLGYLLKSFLLLNCLGLTNILTIVFLHSFFDLLINDIISYTQIILAVVISFFYFVIGVTIFYISYAGAKIRGTLINVGE